MAKIRRSFTVGKPPGEVVDYLRDFSHAEDWDPGTLTCTRLDPGPVREGSTWHNVSQFLGRRAELTYRLERSLPDRLTFVGDNRSATSIDDLTFEPSSAPAGATADPVTGTGAGTRITYRAQIRLRGAARLADPLVRLALERRAGEVTSQMQRVINAL